MGKARDEKVHILPSTTRKGTTLSTSAALDSPSMMSQLITPPQATHTVTFVESENAFDKFDDVSTVLDESGSLVPFLDATLAKSRQIENAETPNGSSITPVDSPELRDYTCDDLDETYVELDDDFIDECHATSGASNI